MGYPIVHFELMGKDPDALRAFYSKVMGWKIEVHPEMDYGVVDTDSGGSGIGGGVGSLPNGSNAVTVYIEVPDTDAVLKEVEAAGGKTTMPTEVIPGMVTFAQFQDPAGNIVGLVKSES